MGRRLRETGHPQPGKTGHQNQHQRQQHRLEKSPQHRRHQRQALRRRQQLVVSSSLNGFAMDNMPMPNEQIKQGRAFGEFRGLTPLLIAPEDFMQLHLKTYRQAIFQNPCSQVGGSNAALGR